MGATSIAEAFGVIQLSTGTIASVAAIGAHCDDVMVAAGAPLLQIAHHNPHVVAHVLVLTGAGTVREVEEKNAFAMFLPEADARLKVADLPEGRLPDHWRYFGQLGDEVRLCRRCWRRWRPDWRL